MLIDLRTNPMDDHRYKTELKQLQVKHHFEEMALFPVWQKADDKEKTRLTKYLGQQQAKELIALIDKANKE